MTSDDALFISEALRSRSLLVATVVIAIIYLFLRSARVTFIPPSLLPIADRCARGDGWSGSRSTSQHCWRVRATGLVDDAIVVIEHLAQRALGASAPPPSMAWAVFFAVLCTAALAAMFIPYLSSASPTAFAEFGFVLAFAVTLCFVAITLPLPRLMGVASQTNPSVEPWRRSAVRGRLYGLLDAALAARDVVIVQPFVRGCRRRLPPPAPRAAPRRTAVSCGRDQRAAGSTSTPRSNNPPRRDGTAARQIAGH
jgi:HAE1 family hydrophobic/amphiphilic exporter-1